MIDSREKNGPYLERQFRAVGIEADIICWPTETGTDFLVTNSKGSVAIQRKVLVSELIGEFDKTLYETLPALKNFSDNPMLLVEENHTISPDGYLHNRTDGRSTEMLAMSYYGYLETVRKMGIDVQTTRDINQSMWLITSIHNYLAKEHYPKHRKYFTVPEQAVGMLCTVPSIGEVRANKALVKSSIRGMVGMKQVDGLTMKQNEKLQNVLRWKAT